MRLRGSTNRILRILLLAFVLTAAWPSGGYDPRLELSYRTEAPADLNPTPSSDRSEDWLSFLTPARTPLVRVTVSEHGQPSRPPAVDAALPLARDSLESTDPGPLPRARYEQYPYNSFTALRPAERGPPCLI
jgi:hypothetical protein